MKAQCIERLISPTSGVIVTSYGWIEANGQRRYWVRVLNDYKQFQLEAPAKAAFDRAVTLFEASWRKGDHSNAQ